MSKKLKAIESTIQPNHKEAEIWVSPTNSDGTKEVKYWNDVKDEWSEGSSEGSEGNRILVYAFKTYILDKTYIATYNYRNGEYYWWFGEYDGDESTHDEYKQAIIDAAKLIEGSDFRYAYGYVDKVTQTDKVTLGYALVNGASTSKLTSWSQQAIGSVSVISNEDFIITERGDSLVENEVHIKHMHRQVLGYGDECVGADYYLSIYYPHVKGTECKVYDKNMKLLLTIENSACAYPINDPYLNEQTIVIEN